MNDLAEASARLKGLNQKIGFTNGCFDILHVGHVHFLHTCKMHCDRLIVAVNSDESVKRLKGPKRPINKESHRLDIINSIRWVDAAFIFHETRVSQIIWQLLPDIWFKAGDYTLETLDGGEKAAAEEVGAQIKIIPIEHEISTTDIIEKTTRKPLAIRAYQGLRRGYDGLVRRLR